MNKKLTKRITSFILSVIMVISIMPTFVINTAADTPSSKFWQILASTDFTQTSWSGSGSDYYTSSSPITSAGGNPIGWSIKYGNRTSDEVLVDSNDGVKLPYESSSYRYQGMLYMSSYNGQSASPIFNGIDSFKIDLSFSFLGTARCNTGYNLDGTRNDVPLIKLANDSSNMYDHRSQYNHQSNYFLQTMWGLRSFDDDDYDVAGNSGSSINGGVYAITTTDNNSSSKINANNVYHYIVYVNNGILGSYVTDDSGNVIINYDPIDISGYSYTPADISSIYLGASEFNWAGRYDVENIAYKSIEIYKGVDSSTFDTSKDKYLYAYFKGDSDDGERMYYAISDDGTNFKPVNNGASVWDNTQNWNIETMPVTAGSNSATGVNISDNYHIRDSYAFIGQNGKCYILATDLNTHNGSWGSTTTPIENSRFYVWEMDSFADIPDTTPWSIDTSRFEGMGTITGGNQVKKAWAPQAIWDPDVGKYMLYWAVGADGISTQVYYIYTSDFKTFDGSPKRLLFPNFDAEGMNSHIDADITYYNGLYYCYFKNEDNDSTGAKRIWAAVAPNASGPYSDFTLFDTGDIGMEGPQVFQIAANKYILMTDGFSNHTYHLYPSSNPYSFNPSNETSSNITSITPRHGSIVRITNDEYNKLKKLILDSVRYKFDVFDNKGSWQYQTDSTNYSYQVADGTYNAENGVLTLTNNCIFVNEDAARNIVMGNEYTVDFYHKAGSSDSTKTAAVIGNYDMDFVRLAENGDFYVNDMSTPIGNAGVDMTENHEFTITYNGYATALMVDNVYVCSTTNNPTITRAANQSLYVALGWSDHTSGGKTSGTYEDLSILPYYTPFEHEDDYFDEFKPSSLVAGQFNQKSYFNTYEADALYYGNLVYSPTNTTTAVDSNGNFIESDHMKYKYFSPANVVGVYDGETSPSFPVVFQVQCRTWAFNGLHDETIEFIQPFADSNDAWDNRNVQFRYNWSGFQSDWQNGRWPVNDNNVNQVFSSVAKGQGTRSDGQNKNAPDYYYSETPSPVQNNTNTPRSWKNSLEYYGNGNESAYYEKITPKLQFGHVSDKNYFYFPTNELKTNFYVINYAPIKDILDGTKKVPGTSMTITELYNNDADNRWMYTKDSYAYALYAMKLINDCNPNNFLSNSTDAANVESQTIACANTIKKAVEVFNNISLEKNQFTVTYNMADGNFSSELVEAGNKLRNIPSNTSTYHFIDNGTDKHKTNIAWSSVEPSGTSWAPSVTPSTSIIPHDDLIYTEAGVDEVCNSDIAQSHVAPTATLNGYTDYACSVCSHINEDNRIWDTTDWSAYTAAVAEAAENVTKTMVYTSDSIEIYSEHIANETSDVEVNDQRVPQTVINTKVTSIETYATNDLVYIDYPVVVNTYVDGSKSSATTNYHYGDSATPSYSGDGNVYKWVRTIGNNSSETLSIATSSMNYYVGSNAQFDIYVSTDNSVAPGTDYSKITVKTKDGNLADVTYVENGTYTVSFNGNNITIGETVLSIQDVTFYSADSIVINDTTIAPGESDTVTIENDTSITVNYSPKGGDYYVVQFSDDSYKKGSSSTMNTAVNAMWDEKFGVTAQNTDSNTIWKLNGEPYAYGSDFNFRVPKSTVITKSTGTPQAIAGLNYFAYATRRAKTVTYIGNFYLPEGATLVECGFKYMTDRTDGATAANNTLTWEQVCANGTKKVLTNNLTDTNQFVLNITRSKESDFVMGAVAYVTYSDSSGTHTVYSNADTKQLQCIQYPN